MQNSTTFHQITGRCFIHIPFAMLIERLDWVIENRIQPEIGLEGDTLYHFPDKEFAKAAEQLHNAGLSCTLHAPFFDLAPGGLDPYILEATRKKLRLAFALLPVFKPASIVCHLGYEDDKHGYKKAEWQKRALETWQELLLLAEQAGVMMALENTYEKSPTVHVEILTALDSPQARFCFDTGHSLSFAKSSWQNWLLPLAPWLGQLHLHDNRGDRDAHLPIGEGVFEWPGFFDFLQEKKLSPLITLEPHSEEHLWKTLENLERLKYLDKIRQQ